MTEPIYKPDAAKQLASDIATGIVTASEIMVAVDDLSRLSPGAKRECERVLLRRFSEQSPNGTAKVQDAIMNFLRGQ